MGNYENRFHYSSPPHAILCLRLFPYPRHDWFKFANVVKIEDWRMLTLAAPKSGIFIFWKNWVFCSLSMQNILWLPHLLTIKNESFSTYEKLPRLRFSSSRTSCSCIGRGSDFHRKNCSVKFWLRNSHSFHQQLFFCYSHFSFSYSF